MKNSRQRNLPAATVVLAEAEAEAEAGVVSEAEDAVFYPSSDFVVAAVRAICAVQV